MQNVLRNLGFLILCSGFISAQTQYKVLYSFHGPDGIYPQSMILDKVGNLYGTTYFGGASNGCFGQGCGVVFRLSHNENDTWTETVLYSFCSVGPNCLDGYYPGSGLVFDAAGNLYGSTIGGGAYGLGEIFQLTPPTQGNKWHMNILYSFCSVSSCPDGGPPIGALAIDAHGNLYSTAEVGGINFGGTIFELSPPSVQDATWTEAVLYEFCSQKQGTDCLDGFNPNGGVTLDKFGNLLGTTPNGGIDECSGGCGTIFKLSRTQEGWAYSWIDPPPSVGITPLAPLSVGTSGTVYGTFLRGGTDNDGAVFKISPDGHLSSAPLLTVDGTYPEAALIPGDGVSYGSAFGSGSEVPGTIFQMSSSGGETVLYKFCSLNNCADGIGPRGLARDSRGALFGVAVSGGFVDNECAYGCGVIFELKP